VKAEFEVGMSAPLDFFGKQDSSTPTTSNSACTLDSTVQCSIQELSQHKQNKLKTNQPSQTNKQTNNQTNKQTAS
jgi:hypothetical protein